MGKSEQNSPTKLQKMIDKEVSIPAFYAFKVAFLNNGRLNPKGRVYLKLVTVFISLVYFLGSMDVIIAGTFLAIMMLLFPILIDLTTELLIPKMKINENSLYDLLAGFGSYLIVMIPFLVIMIIGMNYITETYPEHFESMRSVPGVLILVSGTLFALDVLRMNLHDRAIKRMKEEQGG